MEPVVNSIICDNISIQADGRWSDRRDTQIQLSNRRSDLTEGDVGAVLDK